MTPAVLVLAGHDPTGGAGVDADRAAVERFGARAHCVITAYTEQDGERVHATHPRPAGGWSGDALAELLRHSPDAVKTGLLAGAAHVRAAAEVIDALLRREGTHAVVDPLLSASGGEPFLDQEGLAALQAELLTRDVVLTPNTGEAARLVGAAPAELAAEPEARLAAARDLLARGARAVLVKGGHGREDPVRDLVLERDRPPVWLERPRARGASLHGSGCRYASAVAAQLAAGVPLAEAADEAGRWVAALLG